ncbi:MAG: YIP1 family protein [Planctomycetes bacterium]|nr:YIP1 family protein [Planctomycetota bacterium]
MPCVNHPLVADIAQCAQCGKALCADCVVTLEGRELCGPCKNQAVRIVQRGEGLHTLGRGPSPWEEGPSVGSLFRTVRLVLFSPSEFFSKLKVQGEGHWSFLVALGWPSAALGAILSRVLGLESYGRGELETGMLIGVLVFAPLLLLLGVAIGGAVVHLFLRIFGAANSKIGATYRVQVFAQSVLVFNWIPIVGPVVGGIWGLVLNVIGLKHMHNTSYGRVIAAMFIPTAVIVGIVIVGLVAALTALGR